MINQLGNSGKLTSRVIRAGEVSLTLTCCRTWEIRHCTSPVQHSRAGFGCRDASKPASSVRVWENWSYNAKSKCLYIIQTLGKNELLQQTHQFKNASVC